MSIQENPNCPFCGFENLTIPETTLKNMRPALALFGALRLMEGGMTIRESDDFVAVPDALPIGDGEHILIIPKQHTYSYVGMERSNCNLGDNLARFVHDTATTLFPKGTIYFEHGAFKPGEKYQSIFHTHGHLVHTDLDLIDELTGRLRKDGLPVKEISLGDENYPHVLKKKLNGHGYLFMMQGRRGIYVDEGDSEVALPSQFGQYNVHELTRSDQNPYWNWKYLLPVNRPYTRTMQIAVQRTAQIIDRWKR